MVWERTSPQPALPWQELALESLEGDIDIRVFLKECLANHGHVVFVRSPTNQRCHCWESRDGAFEEGDPNCSDCQGFGFYYIDRRTRAYRRPAFGTFGFTGAATRQQIGELGVADQVWYFEHTATPVIGHHIIEVTTDDNGEPTLPFQIERTWAIKLSHLYREKRGRPEYWACLARERSLGA